MELKALYKISYRMLTHEFILESKVFDVSVLLKEAPLNLIGRFGFKSERGPEKRIRESLRASLAINQTCLYPASTKESSTSPMAYPRS